MRRIFIDKSIRSIADSYAQEVKRVISPANKIQKLITSFQGKKVKALVADPKNPKKEIETIHPENDKFIAYLKLILEKLNSGSNGLLVATPSEFIKMREEFDNVLPRDLLKTKLKKNRVAHPFHELVTDCLNYNKVRNDIIASYIRQLGVRTCVYCNASYTITVDNIKNEDTGEKRMLALMDIDHWQPKSEFPYLSISFFNFQPSCPVCNRTKRDDTGEFFGLYTDDPKADLDVFHFDIPNDKLALFRVTGDAKDLSLDFKAVDPNNEPIRKHMDDVLHISELYTQHMDMVEEILRRKEYYNDAFIEGLKPLFEKTDRIPTQSDVTRFILGMYPNPDEALRRPLNKMMLDIFNKK